MLIRSAFLVARKDLVLHFGFHSTGLIQAVLLGLLLVFLFSLSLRIGEKITPSASAGIFWMASCFCQVLIFNTLYAHEDHQGQRKGLLLCPAPIQGVWIGKAITGFCLLLLAQLIFFPSVLIFLGQTVSPFWYLAAGMALIVDIGMVALGSLLGALSHGHSTRESLFSIILFPLLVPLLFAAIRIGALAFSGTITEEIAPWFGMAVAFDAIYIAAGLFFFPLFLWQMNNRIARNYELSF